MSIPDASEVYDVEIIEPDRTMSWFRRGVVVVTNLFLEGQGPTSSGGRRAIVVERASGHQVGEYSEPAGDDGTSDFAMMLADHGVADAESFRERWLGPPMSAD